MSMPVFNLDQLTEGMNDFDGCIVRGAFTTRGYKDGLGRLREAKPFKTVKTFEQGCINYVWRMLCFDIVGSGKHACMPVCADFDLWDALEARDGSRPRHGNPGYDDWRQSVKNLTDEMNSLIKRAERSIPLERQKGIVRWGRALGML